MLQDYFISITGGYHSGFRSAASRVPGIEGPIMEITHYRQGKECRFVEDANRKFCGYTLHYDSNRIKYRIIGNVRSCLFLK